MYSMLCNFPSSSFLLLVPREGNETGVLPSVQSDSDRFPWNPVPNDERQQDQGSKTKHSRVFCTFENNPGLNLNQGVFLLTGKRWFLCSSSLFALRWFDMWRLFCNYLFLVSPVFGTITHSPVKVPA